MTASPFCLVYGSEFSFLEVVTGFLPFFFTVPNCPTAKASAFEKAEESCARSHDQDSFHACSSNARVSGRPDMRARTWIVY
jgi:hypothetical protein